MSDINVNNLLRKILFSDISFSDNNFGVMATERGPRISLEIDPGLRRWLEDQAAKMPDVAGKPGPKRKLSEYVRMVLEADRARGHVAMPGPSEKDQERLELFRRLDKGSKATVTALLRLAERARNDPAVARLVRDLEAALASQSQTAGEADRPEGPKRETGTG